MREICYLRIGGSQRDKAIADKRSIFMQSVPDLPAYQISSIYPAIIPMTADIPMTAIG